MPSSISTVRPVGVPSSSMVSEPRRCSIAPSSMTVTPGVGNALADPAREGRRALAVEVAFEPVADRFVQQHAGPAGAHHDRHLASRRGDRIRGSTSAWAKRHVDRAVPLRFLEQRGRKDSGRRARGSRSRVGRSARRRSGRRAAPAAARRRRRSRRARTMSITLQLAASADADLHDARIAGPRRGVDLLAQRDLLGERDEAERVFGAIHRLVGALRRRRGRALARVEQLERRCGALDRRFADLVGVGEGGGLAGHAAQAEARGAVIIGGLQPAVVEAERLARAILQVKLAIVVGATDAWRRAARAASGSRLR